MPVTGPPTTRVLVTGASGYIGSRVASDLIENREVETALLVRNPSKLNCLPSRPHRVHNLSDFGTPQALDALLTGIDAVVHLLGANAQQSAADPVAALDTTVGWTVRLRDAALKRFIYVSTVHVYGRLVGAITEDSPPRPTHPYAIEHHCAEDFVLAASPAVSPTVVRLSNAVGAPLSPETDCWMLAANDFCRQAATAGSILVRSPGGTKRDFIGMTDVVSTLTGLAISTPGPKYKLMNLASGVATAIGDLARLVASRCEVLLHKRVEVIMAAGDDGGGEPEFTIDIERLREAGFAPRSSLADEIDATLRFCAAHFEPRPPTL